jgi:CDP-diacylglycerol--serine O-phosphatidyltransferase
VVIVLGLAVLYRLSLTGPHVWLGAWEIADKVFHPLSIVYVVSGSLMISTIRIPKP